MGSEIVKVGDAKSAAAALAAVGKQIESVLPKHMDIGRFLRMSANAVARVPRLRNCTKDSFIRAILAAGEMGLEPSRGQCAIVPYGEEAQCQPMYQGLMDLARRSGQISTIYAEVVREGDKFHYALGLDPVLVHEPAGDPSKPWVAVYAVAHLRDGGKQFVYLHKPEVMRLKNRNQAVKKGVSSPWDTDEEAMAKAKAVKQLCKFLPQSPEMRAAIEADTANEIGDRFIPLGGEEIVPQEEKVSPAPWADPPADKPAEQSSQTITAGGGVLPADVTTPQPAPGPTSPPKDKKGEKSQLEKMQEEADAEYRRKHPDLL